MRVLVVAAHPDDEVLGCGGTMARLASEGDEVYVAILGQGVTSRYASPSEAPPGELQALRESARRAAEILGVREVFHYDLPDNRFDTVALLEVVKMLERLIADIRPRVVYTQHGGDLNVDHVVTYRAVLTATRPLAGTPVAEVYAFEVPSSTEWAFQSFAPVFRPSLFVDITRTLPTKVKAMEVYESEVRRFPHPRSPEAIEVGARRWGSAAGLEAAEAFEIVRVVR